MLGSGINGGVGFCALTPIDRNSRTPLVVSIIYITLSVGLGSS